MLINIKRKNRRLFLNKKTGFFNISEQRQQSLKILKSESVKIRERR